MTTRIVIHAGWLDRLRLLLSGKALVTIYQQTDVEVGNCKSSSAFCVIRPGGGDQ
jgi:hypothetical protein